MVSVAMCTYNGETYLTEQLESIAKQTRQVDELVVCDDGSTDQTIPILERFAGSVSFPVRIHVNGSNLGSTRNFEKCLLLCAGDTMVLCDQDDVWRQDRVQRLCDYLQTHPYHDAVFSNADLIDDDGALIPDRKLWDNFGFDTEKQQTWRSGKANEILFQSYIVTGATLAIRKNVLDRLAPFPTHLGPYIHDAWMAIALGVLNKIGFVDDTLISYRVHASQQVGFGKKDAKVSLGERLKRDRQFKLEPIRKRAELLGDLVRALEAVEGVVPESLIKLKELHSHFRRRAELPDKRVLRFRPVLTEAAKGRYKMSSTHWWLPLLGDLFE